MISPANQGRARALTPVARWAAYPRTLLVLLAVMFGIVAPLTWVYDPGYLMAPRLWAVSAAVAAVCCIAAAWHQRRVWTALAGACACVATLTRGLALGISLLRGPPGAGAAAKGVGTTVWIAGSWLVWALWVHVITPWAVVVRRGTPHDSIPKADR